MKKLISILFIFLAYSLNAQTYPNGAFNTLTVKNSPTVISPNYLVTQGMDGKYGKIEPVNLPLIHKNSTPETKTGGFTSGGINNTYPNDNWIALGTSVTMGGAYTVPMALRLNLNVTNVGVSGSTSNDIVNHYSDIPTLNSGNQNNYRLVSFEYSINDAAQGVPLATFRTNLVNGILNAKSKNWANEKILVINGNYCTRPDILAVQEAYANEAIAIAKEQGVQYSDTYNYTKNNGGDTLLSDQVHPTAAGGLVYVRGVVASMQGGGEFTNALTVVNRVYSGGVTSEKSISTLESIKTGNGTNNNPTNTVNGDVIVPLNAGMTTQHSQTGLISRFTVLEDFGAGLFGPTLRNYVEGGRIKFYTAGLVRGSQILAMDMDHTGFANFLKGLSSGENINIAFQKPIQYTGSWTSSLTMANSLGHTIFNNGFSTGNIDFNVSNGVTNASNLALRLLNNRSVSVATKLILATAPATSASSYDVLVRNQANGDVEKISGTFATDSAVLHNSGNESFTGVKSSTNTGSSQINGISLINNGTTGSYSFRVDVSGSGIGQYGELGTSATGNLWNLVNKSSSGIAHRLRNESTGVGSFSDNVGSGVLHQFESNTGSTGDLLRFTKNGVTTSKIDSEGKFYSTNTGTSTNGIDLENSGTTGTRVLRIFNTNTGVGQVNANTSTGIGTYSSNLSTGVVHQFESATGSTGDLIQFTKNNVLTGKVAENGAITTPKLNISTGANSAAGNATLVGGTITVTTTAATSSSLIMLTRKTAGGTIGTYLEYTTTNGQFTITSQNPLETSTVTYLIIN